MEKLFHLATDQRNGEARDQIVEHFRGPLAAFVQSRLGHRLREIVDADDVVQETFSLLWRATKQLKDVFGDTESLRLPARSIELENERDQQ